MINTIGNCSDSIDNALKKGGAAYGMLRWLIKKKEMDMKVKKVLYTQLIRPTMEYGQEAWKGRRKKVEKLMLLERKILRAMTGMYRRPNGKWHRNDDLYKAAQMEENIGEHMERSAERYEVRKTEHRNEWYRSRMEELFRRRIEGKFRTEEYDKHTAEWKKKYKETEV